MALVEVKFFAASLQKKTAMMVILPEDLKGSFPVMYLLHGLSDDYTTWTRRTSIERYLDGKPLVVVMPDGGRGWYTDAVNGYAYESHIMKDVMGFVEDNFSVKKGGRNRAIAGLSMGGYGAMKLGFKHPSKFAAVCSHSSAFQSGHERMEGRPETDLIFGGQPGGNSEDVFHLAGKLAGRKYPALKIDCGREDGLIDVNRRFVRHLRKLGLEHVYKEYKGAHNWDYWDAHIRETIDFVLDRFGAKDA